MGLFERMRVRGRAGGDAAAPGAQDALRLIGEGNALEDAGRHGDALQRYDDAIRCAPALARAHLNRGNALLALGDAEGAARAYATALVHDPDYAAAHYNLGNAHLRAGRREAALAAYMRALAIKPEFADAEVALGALHEDLGQPDAAAASYRRALQIDPGYAAAHSNLGNVLQRLGQHAAAVESYRRALECDAQLVMALYGLANALQALGRNEEAIVSYRLVLHGHPKFAEAHGNLGIALQALGRVDEAIASLRRAAEILPDVAALHFNLANALLDSGQAQDAIAGFRRALSLIPEFADAHLNLGNALRGIGRLEAALTCYRRVLEIEPDHVLAHNNIGNTLKDLGRLDEASASYRKALALDPDLDWARSNLLFIHNYQARPGSRDVTRRSPELWRNGDKARATVRGLARRSRARSLPARRHRDRRFAQSRGRLLRRSPACRPLVAIRRPPRASCLQRSCSDRSGQQANRCALPPMDGDRRAFRRGTRPTDPRRRHRHPDRSFRPHRLQSPTRVRLEAGAGAGDLARLFRDHRRRRRSITSLPIRGRCRHPKSANFTEKIWRLPDTRLCFTPPDEPVAVAPLRAADNGYVTFGCFNHLTKMSDDVVTLWSRVLHARARTASLFLKAKPDPGGCGAAAHRRAICHPPHGRRAPDIGGRRSHAPTYLAAYHRVDIALDPFPYPGGTTTVESLWMGVPVLTLAGERFLSRQGVGLLDECRACPIGSPPMPTTTWRARWRTPAISRDSLHCARDCGSRCWPRPSSTRNASPAISNRHCAACGTFGARASYPSP